MEGAFFFVFDMFEHYLRASMEKKGEFQLLYHMLTLLISTIQFTVSWRSYNSETPIIFV